MKEIIRLYMRPPFHILLETIVLTVLSILIGLFICKLTDQDVYGDINIIYLIIVISSSFLAGIVFELVANR